MISFYSHVLASYGRIAFGYLLFITLHGSLLTLGCLAVTTSLLWVIEEPTSKHIAIALFYAVFAFVVIWYLVLPGLLSLLDLKADNFRVRIVPYFEKAIDPKADGRDHGFFMDARSRKICINWIDMQLQASVHFPTLDFMTTSSGRRWNGMPLTRGF